MFTNYRNAATATVNIINQFVNLLFVSVLTLTMFVLAVPNTALAQNRSNREVPSRRTPADDNEHTVFVNPLSPNDPRAQLDPALVNVPAMPRPIYGASVAEGDPGANATVEYNIRTGAANNRRWNPIAVPEFVESILSSGHAQLPGSTGANLQQDNADARPNVQRSESVIGTDERQKVNNTASFPWRAIVKLYSTYPNGNTYGCSGTMVNAKYVLTAGHCIYSAADGGWASRVQVIPGLNGTYQPYGATWGTMMRTYAAWTNNRSADHDFALVTLASPLGSSTGWLGLKVYSDLGGRFGNLAGYPGDRDNSTGMYYHFGSMLSATAYRVFHQIDTFGGQSGSGIYHIETGPQRYIFAVHTNGNEGDNQNKGCRLDSGKFASIAAWIASGN